MNTTPEVMECLDDPIDLLQTCHEKATHFVSLLEKLQRYLRGVACPDDPAVETALQLMRYFDRAAPDHHADEERDLFPILGATLSATTDLQALMRNLSDQHRDLESLFAEIRPWLVGIVNGDVPATPAAQISAFTSLYRAHIQIEEAFVLPVARLHLQEMDRIALARAMALRRRFDQALAIENRMEPHS
ncbi:hemerythrin domain-containing protein [Piscinibacterium candidicorallinum]|uniref:Hemerythrin domain-containing protein n=1 Tax=Piscinibacterium candidicorallinum TaxID=1793872 RepID=A0ABV7H5J8_9BURK